MLSKPRWAFSADFAVGVCIVLLTLAAFFPALSNHFTDWDDRAHILDNAQVRVEDVADLAGIFTSTVNKTYIPLTTLSYAIEVHFFGFNPFVAHLNNLLLHITVALLVFGFIRRLGYSVMVSGLAALVFAVHPMRVESVAWATERKDVLCGLFYMLSLNCYLVYLRKKSRKFYGLSLIFGLLSMFSKIMAVTLPAALLICDWHRSRSRSKLLVLDKIPYLLYIIPLAAITFAQNTIIYTASKDLWKSVLTGLWTFTFYPAQFVWPAALSPVYLLPQPVSLAEKAYVHAVVIMCLLGLLCILGRKNKAVMCAFLFYLAGLPLILRFGAVDFNRGVIAADRYIYLSGIGFCLLAGAALEYFYKVCVRNGRVWQRGWGVLAGGLIVTLGALTYQQCHIWKDTQSLMTAVIRRYPAADFAYNNRGIVFMRAGQLDRALADFSRAIDLDRHKPHYYMNRANLYGMMEQFDLAMQDFQTVITLKPEDSTAYFNRGALYNDMGRYDLAVRDFDKALQIKPDYRAAYRNRLWAANKL